MGWNLVPPGGRRASGYVKRFDPRFWTVNFPRPMMAAATCPAADALQIDAVFYQANDLAGVIWAAEDVIDHPLLAYETARDFRGCVLRFHWRSSGVLPLDAVNGPTLTIEGRDALGNPRSWYVRLWNYAEGTSSDADVTLDFGALVGGFLLPAEAEPVFAGDVDRMFISLVAPSYSGEATPLAQPAEARVTLTGLHCVGPGSVLAIGDAMVPAHGLRIASGYDDAYNLTPTRLLRNMLQLGYRGTINHYVGMSHYFRLAAAEDGFIATIAGGVLNVAAEAWHARFAAEARALGYGLILSMSFELLDRHCPESWKQRAADGAPALTGWDPPSTLLSPANVAAMGYLQQVACAFTGVAQAAGQPVRFQIGEPWWWVTSAGAPCLYDDAARAAFGGAPVPIASIYASLSAPQTALLDAAGAQLAQATAALAGAVRAAAADAELLVLAYLPSVLDPRAPEIRRANLPVAWADPAFERLQLEDYDWVIAGDAGATARGVATALDRLGYPIERTDYFSGFVLHREAAASWQRIDAAAEEGRARGHADTYIWAIPQVMRDGFVHFDSTERAAMDPFDEIEFPIAIGTHASVEPGFSTAVVTSASGAEQRNVNWSQARLRFDAGPGVRSEADMQVLIAFFRARRGQARGFLFRDPFDDSSAGMTDPPGPLDIMLGEGDGATTVFPLVKRYGEGDEAEQRRITRPIAGSVRIAVTGTERIGGWSLGEGGVIEFESAPAAGAVVTAGYRFAVPVRFAQDQLPVSLAALTAGEAPSVPLIEIREDLA